jgi:hypothetical protein
MRRFLPLLPFLLAACTHSEPFRSGDVPDAGPRTPGAPLRLTYNSGRDLTPAWELAGSGLVYAFDRADHADRDRCIGVLPPEGGTQRATKCYPNDPAEDSTDVLDTPAPGPDGRLAWLEAHAARGEPQPPGREVRAGSLSSLDSGRSVLAFPFDSPSGQRLSTATHLAWLGNDALVFVGAAVVYSAPCTGCAPDTLVNGLEVDRIDLSASPPAVEVIPGTDSATSVWPAADGRSIYFTVRGDSRVYQRDLGAGTVTAIHDFAPDGIVRDAAVLDSVMVAVVGGRVQIIPSPNFGRIQVDSGGVLHLFDLRTGRDTALAVPASLVRHPALARSAGRIAVEVYPDAGALTTDLWLFDIP